MTDATDRARYVNASRQDMTPRGAAVADEHADVPERVAERLHGHEAA